MAIFKCAGRKRLYDDGQPYCAYEAPRVWLGPCPSCRRYYAAEKIGADVAPKRVTAASLTEIAPVQRIPTGIATLDGTVLSGGLVPGNIYLVAGSKGIGKSSLMMAISDSVAQKRRSVLYASGEESAVRVGEIARRMQVKNNSVDIIGDASDIDEVIAHCKETKPTMLVLDSLQVMTTEHCEGSEGSAAQAEAVINRLQAHCMRSGMCAWVMNHMQKGGKDLAGPEVVGHLVDVVFFLDKHDEDDDLRVLHAPEKNRTGSIKAEAFFKMDDDTGLLTPCRPPTQLTLVGDDE